MPLNVQQYSPEKVFPGFRHIENNGTFCDMPSYITDNVVSNV